MSYSLENAVRFRWSSVTGNLHPERVSHLETYLRGRKILDAGCGGGAFVDLVAQKGYDVIGVDNHAEFLQMAQERYGSGRYVRADILRLPFADHSFDCTYCFDVLEHVDHDTAIKELVRVTIHRLIITVPKRDEMMCQFGLTFFHYQDTTHLRYYTETSLKELLQKISYSRASIFPELALPAQALVSSMLEPEKLGLRTFHRKILRFVLRKLLDASSFRQIYTGLVAVVDL
jgi:ubiquinone/menaquinone biosynthesis C-methylase UbiE